VGRRPVEALGLLEHDQPRVHAAAVDRAARHALRAREHRRARAVPRPLHARPADAGLCRGCSVTTGTATAPIVTVKAYFHTWAQPDAHDLLGNPIQQVPDGLVASRFVMHELPQLNAGSNVIRHTLMGNEIRGIVWIVRNSLANGTTRPGSTSPTPTPARSTSASTTGGSGR
jgi:hypothetical protein